MNNIHIGGVYYGQHNIGDEAIVYSMIKTFSSNNILSVSSYGSEWIDELFPNVERHMIPVRFQKPKYGIYTVPVRNVIKDYIKVKKEIAFYNEKDIYICGGATILSDCPWYSLRTVQLAGKSQNDVYLWGVGMAEINDKKTLHYIKDVLNKDYVKKIFTRDEFVRERLIDLDVTSDKVYVSYDPAIMIESHQVDLDIYLTKEQRELYLNGNINIVLSVSGEADVVKKTPISVIKKAVENLQRRYGANIFLIPTGCGKQCKDTEFLCSIASDLNNKSICVIKKEFNPSDLVGFLQKIDLIISSRLHMNILGACASTPSIGLIRNRKIVDFARIIGLPYLELETLNCEQLENEAVNILNNNDFYTAVIKSKVAQMRKQYREAVKIINL